MYADYLTKCGTAHICHCCSSRLISPARRAHGSNPAAAGLLLWAHAGTDRRTPYSFIVPDLHTTQAVPHILIKNFSCKIVVKPVCLSDCMHIFVYKKGWLGSWVVSMRCRRDWVQIAVTTFSGNSLRQTVHTHFASVHQAAKLVAALLRVVRVTAGLAEVMAAYRRVYDSRHLQADCQELGSAPESYAR